MGDRSPPLEVGNRKVKTPFSLLANAPGRLEGDLHDRIAVYSPRPHPAEVWSPMPPLATASLLSPLSSSSLELISGLVVLSDAPRRTGPE